MDYFIVAAVLALILVWFADVSGRTAMLGVFAVGIAKLAADRL